jgi:predicted NBD/HSP70 family sugar kinase
LDYEAVLSLAADGDPVAVRVVKDAGNALGVVIGTVAAIAGPAKILISGEGTDLVPLVIDIVRAKAVEVQHWTIPEVPIEVVPFTFTEWARGAAVIALRRQIEDTVAMDA